MFEPRNQPAGVGFPFAACLLDLQEQQLDLVGGFEDERDQRGGKRAMAVAYLAEQIFRACATAPRVSKEKNPQVPLMVWTVRKTLAIPAASVGVAFEPHEFTVERGQVFAALRQKLANVLLHVVRHRAVSCRLCRLPLYRRERGRT